MYSRIGGSACGCSQYKEVDDGTGREERGVQIFPPPKKKDPIAILVGFGLCRDRFFLNAAINEVSSFFVHPFRRWWD
jgi:hypothetical protein